MQQGIFEASLLSELQLNEFAVAFSMLLKARNMRARCVLFILREYARCKTVSARAACYVPARVKKQCRKGTISGSRFLPAVHTSGALTSK